MSEYEVIFWIVIAVMAFLAFGLWLAEVLGKSESQKRIDRINKEADELIKQAQAKLDKRERLDTNGVSYD
jgi:hypothetical protein